MDRYFVFGRVAHFCYAPNTRVPHFSPDFWENGSDKDTAQIQQTAVCSPHLPWAFT